MTYNVISQGNNHEQKYRNDPNSFLTGYNNLHRAFTEALLTSINTPSGDRLEEETGMVEEMGMTNKQFQGFIRLALGWLEKAVEESPENESLKSLKEIFQSMLEDV